MTLARSRHPRKFRTVGETKITKEVPVNLKNSGSDKDILTIHEPLNKRIS